MKDPVEAAEHLPVMGHGGSRGLLLDGELAQEVHDDPTHDESSAAVATSRQPWDMLAANNGLS